MSHGHVLPRPDGVVVRCGGPALCNECNLELVALNAKLNSYVYCQFCRTRVPRNSQAIEAHLLECTAHPLNRKLFAAERVVRYAEGMIINAKAGIPVTLACLDEEIMGYRKQAPAVSDLELFELVTRVCEVLGESREIGLKRRGVAMYFYGMARAIEDEQTERENEHG